MSSFIHVGYFYMHIDTLCLFTANEINYSFSSIEMFFPHLKSINLWTDFIYNAKLGPQQCFVVEHYRLWQPTVKKFFKIVFKIDATFRTSSTSCVYVDTWHRLSWWHESRYTELARLCKLNVHLSSQKW